MVVILSALHLALQEELVAFPEDLLPWAASSFQQLECLPVTRQCDILQQALHLAQHHQAHGLLLAARAKSGNCASAWHLFIYLYYILIASFRSLPLWKFLSDPTLEEPVIGAGA